jgi:uncharacterized membrane protein (DUF485 family)
MPNRPRFRWNLALLLWGVAYVALGIGAILAGANAPGVLGVALAGGLLWAVALGVEEWRPRPLPRKPASRFILMIFVVAGCLEAAGARSAFAEAAMGQVFWFAMATGFAAAGLVTASRRDPSDGALVCQLFFHGFMLFPALARVAAAWLFQPGVPNNLALLTRTFIIIVGVAAPTFILTTVLLLSHDLQRPIAERNGAWLALLAAESAYMVALFRWAQDGV